MSKKERPPEEEKSSMEWLLTFSDVLTLLITFFVLLISMSSMDSKKLRDTSSFFRGALANLEAGKGRAAESVVHNRQAKPVSQPLISPPDPTTTPPVGIAPRQIANRLTLVMRRADVFVDRLRRMSKNLALKGRHPLDKKTLDLLSGARPVKLIRGTSKTDIGLHVALLFEPGQVKLRAGAGPLIAELKRVVAGRIDRIEVPIGEKGKQIRVRSPWILSAWRSSLLARQLRIDRSIAAGVSGERKRNYIRLVWVKQQRR
jgi:flagellar motor protein MotB